MAMSDFLYCDQNSKDAELDKNTERCQLMLHYLHWKSQVGERVHCQV